MKDLNSGKVARGSKEWKALNEALRVCNEELKKIKEEGKAAEKLTDSIERGEGEGVFIWQDKYAAGRILIILK